MDFSKLLALSPHDQFIKNLPQRRKPMIFQWNTFILEQRYRVKPTRKNQLFSLEQSELQHQGSPKLFAPTAFRQYQDHNKIMPAEVFGKCFCNF